MNEIEQFFKSHPWLMGKSEVKRAFAIFFYFFAAQFLLGIFLLGFALFINLFN